MSFTRFRMSHIKEFLSKFNTDSKVILAIRRAEHLKRLVYVACNAKAAMNNFIEWVVMCLTWLFCVSRLMNEKTILNKCLLYHFERWPVLWNAESHVQIRHIVCAERHPTEFTGPRSVRFEPWLWICSRRPCTLRCFCFWREWTTIPSSNRPAALRKRRGLSLKNRPCTVWSVAWALHTRTVCTSMLTLASFHIIKVSLRSSSLNFEGSVHPNTNLLLYQCHLMRSLFHCPLNKKCYNSMHCTVFGELSFMDCPFQFENPLLAMFTQKS